MQEEPDRRPGLPEIGPPPGNIIRYLHPPSSGGTSSTVSEGTAENLLKGVEDLETQEEKMTEATTDLLAALLETGGGPWGTDTGLTEPDLLAWLGVQQDRVKELKEKLDRRGRELARMAEFEEDKSATAPEHPKENSDIRRLQVSFRAYKFGSM